MVFFVSKVAFSGSLESAFPRSLPPLPTIWASEILKIERFRQPTILVHPEFCASQTPTSIAELWAKNRSVRPSRYTMRTKQSRDERQALLGIIEYQILKKQKAKLWREHAHNKRMHDSKTRVWLTYLGPARCDFRCMRSWKKTEKEKPTSQQKKQCNPLGAVIIRTST